MKIDSERLEDHQVKLTVEFDDETFDGAKRRAARQIAKRTKIPGFRPGKAPYHIIERTVGEQAIIERGMEFLIDDQYAKVIEEAEIDPYGPGQLDEIVSVDPLVLDFLVPLASEVELGDYRSIRIPYELEEIEDDDVDEVLDNLQQSQAIEEPAERSAQEGDRIFLQMSGKRAVLEEGKDEIVIQERQHSVIIQPEEVEDSIEWPYAGFSREMIDMAVEDEKNFTYTFSEDSTFESLASVAVEFHVQVDEVKSRSLPEFDDEFAQSIGEFETLADLRAEIKDNLEQQSKENYDNEYDDDLLTQIIDQSTIAYPPQMLEEEINLVTRRLENQLEAQNLDLETYLLTQGMSKEEFREDTTPIAESRLKRTLVLLEISTEEEIQLDPDQLQTETERTINAMTQFMSTSDKRKMGSEGAFANLAGNIAAEMAINQSLEFLRSMAKGELNEAEESDEPDQTTEEDNEIVSAESEGEITEDAKLEAETVEVSDEPSQTSEEVDEIIPEETEQETIEESKVETDTAEASEDDHLLSDVTDESIEETSVQDTEE